MFASGVICWNVLQVRVVKVAAMTLPMVLVSSASARLVTVERAAA